MFGNELSRAIGRRHSVELDEGSTVSTLINKLSKLTGSTRAGFLGGFKVGGPNLAVLVNGRNVALGEGVETELRDGDEVVLIPFVVGG